MGDGAPQDHQQQAPPELPASPEHEGVPVLRAVFVYGVAAFCAGFVLGVVRELALVPVMGERAARWVEFPFIIAMTFMAARFALARKAQWSTREAWTIGAGGVVVLLTMEATFALHVVKQPLETWLASFDIRQGALFPAGLAIMACAPWMMARWRGGLIKINK